MVNDLNRVFSMSEPVTLEEIRRFADITFKRNEVKLVLLCLLGFHKDLLPTVSQKAGSEKIVTISGLPSFTLKSKSLSLANNEKKGGLAVLSLIE